MLGYPFDGLEGPENNPYTYIRKGIITKVISSFEDNHSVNYFTLILSWLDRGGVVGSATSTTGRVKLTYPHMSRGWGLQYKPSIGDIVVCGFRLEGYPVLLGFESLGYGTKVLNKNEFGYFFRDIDDGEYCWKSKQGAEWYLDKKGSLRLIVRDQTLTRNTASVVTIDTKTGLAKTGMDLDVNPLQINENVVLDNPVVEVTVGQVFNSDFSTETLSSKGKSIRLQVQDYKSGNKILIDSDGNLEIIATGSINIDCDDINIGAGNLQPAVKGTSLKQWLESHIHPTSVGPTGVPTVTLPSTVLSTNVKVK
jgi:hypothetical protein